MEQIEKYIDAETKAASAMTTELDIVHEVAQAMKVLGGGVAANKTAIKDKLIIQSCSVEQGTRFVLSILCSCL